MTAPARIDRRQRRRLETIEEIVDVAVEVMTEHGVGGLSLGEVARRMGMRTPSLYVYFDSKNAVYDAVFARGWRSAYETTGALHLDVEGTVRRPAQLEPYLLLVSRTFVRWTIENPAHAQLMMWRPVPGYEPSADAFAAAVDALEAARSMFVRLRDLDLLRSDVALDEMVQTWTVITTGVMTRQLANAPQESFDEGRVTATLPALVAMFVAHYRHSGSPTKGKK
ncbi:MAG: TetR/AcrR family transcriptional regulator [Frankiaceae bacterium]|nr:TetR/AcrR family transcriptional regulator [Frankiaceae bacterium]